MSARPLSRIFRHPVPATVLIMAALAAFVGTSADTAAGRGPARATQAPVQPNILWITSEDNGPQLGAYGDSYADTPSLDALAARGFRYRTAWSNGPVCGASRTVLIAGMYPESNGGEHMRSLVPLPGFARLYPALLREAGYYTTNNSKTDYNFAETETVWDESSNTAHWKNRRPGQPFFAVFNITTTHESQMRARPHTWAHDLSLAPVPPYMPDVRETREDWAQYYDQMTIMDRTAGQRIAELEAAGLADDTVVMYFGDHGSGMPRSKRFPYDSGLRVPLVVHVPERFRQLAPADVAPGGEVTRLVSFVDFAPTLLSLAGVEPPAWMQGRAFLGAHAAPAPEYLFGFRGRMDERYDLMRTVRDARYIYIRNYMPHRPYGQHVAYMFETPTTAVWKRMYDAGQLTPEQSVFWKPKAVEELYDLETDPWETRNLAGSAEHREVRDRLRAALDAHAREVRDVGFLPEYELHRGPAGSTPWDRGHDPARYDFDAVYAMAQQASDRQVPLARILPKLADSNPVVRYWAATGVLVRGEAAVAESRDALERLLADAEPGPRIVAAEALGRFGAADVRARAIAALLEDADSATHGEYYVALLALYSLNQLPDLPADVVAAVQQLPNTAPGEAPNMRGRGDYVPRLKAAIAANVR